MFDPFSQGQFLHGVERDAFWNWIVGRRWFGGKARKIIEWKVDEIRAIGGGCIAELEVTYADGREIYAVPLAWSEGDCGAASIASRDGRVLCDATATAEFRDWLFQTLEPGAARQRLFPGGGVPESKVLTVEQSNTSIIYGGKLFVKLYRRLVKGPNPDAEITRYLSDVAGFPHVPAFGGTVTWHGASLALAVALAPNESDAWPLALAAAREFFASGEMGVWLERAALLGRRTGEMHSALLRGIGGDFAPEPFTARDLEELEHGITHLESSTRVALGERAESLPPSAAQLARSYLARPGRGIFCDVPAGAVKTRTHGDYHLGQVLWTGSDFVIIDFEGEPSRTLAERRAKRSPLRDVAGMLRSFHYAAYAAGGGDTAEQWVERSQAAFLEAWKDAAPALHAGLCLLPLFIEEKALYELAYEMNNRPDWIGIPLRALG